MRNENELWAFHERGFMLGIWRDKIGTTPKIYCAHHECQAQVFELAFRGEFLRLGKLDIKFKLILFYII